MNEIAYVYPNLITFFRVGEEGSIWTGKRGSFYISAWAKNDISSFVAEYYGNLEPLREQLRKEMKGGVIVDVQPNAAVRVVPVLEYDAPQRFVCIDGGGGIKQFDVAKVVRCETGDRYLIPVDRQSSDILKRLCDGLKYLSPDQERSIFHILGEPSLEQRMLTVEKQIRAIRGEQRKTDRREPRGNADIGVTKTPWWSLRLGPVPVWCLLLLLIVLVAVLFFVLHGSGPEGTAQSGIRAHYVQV